MQPNNQQGFYQPGQAQPGQPVMPPPQPTPVGSPQQPVNPAALQAALDEPASAAPQPAASEQYDDEGYDDESVSDEAPVTWSAQEYIHQEKGTVWFIIFAVITLALLGLAVFLQQWSFAVLIVVIAAVIVVSSKRPPRELTYSLSNDGLTIDNKLHKFGDFKSFGIIRDGEEFSVMLIPTQRFQPGITVYFPEDAGEAIVDMLGSRLPMKDLHLDVVDRLVRLLRL